MSVASPSFGRELDRAILRLAIPALGALAADPLVSLVDTAYVGRLGRTPLGALGVAVAIFAVVFFMFNFLAYGTTPLIAGAIARGDREEAGRLAAAAVLLAVAIGVVTAGMVELLSDPILRLMGAQAGMLADANRYLSIRVLGMPAVMVVTVSHGIYRGHQDTRTPLLVTIGISVLNLVLDPILIFGLGWGLAGAAWATMGAQWIGAGWFMVMLAHDRSRFALRARWPGWDAIRPLIGAGRALIIRSGSLLGAFTLATAVATRQGEAVVAAHQVAMQIWLFLALVVDALAIAGQALIGLHLHHDPELAGRYATRLLGWGLAVGLAVAAAIGSVSGYLPGWFSADQEVIAAVGSVYGFIVVMQPLNAIVFVWDGIAIGCSSFTFLAAAMLVAALVMVGALAVVQRMGWGLTGIWWALTVMMLVRFATLAYWHLTGPLRNVRDPSLGSPAAG